MIKHIIPVDYVLICSVAVAQAQDDETKPHKRICEFDSDVEKESLSQISPGHVTSKVLDTGGASLATVKVKRLIDLKAGRVGRQAGPEVSETSCGFSIPAEKQSKAPLFNQSSHSVFCCD